MAEIHKSTTVAEPVEKVVEGKAVESLMLQHVNDKTIEDTLKSLGRVAAEERSAVSAALAGLRRRSEA